MIRNPTTSLPNATHRTPDDLRRAVGRHQLAAMVHAAVPSWPVRVQLPESPERLLALLTYSYAAGVYNSSEIQREIGSDDLSGLLGSPLPLDHHVLRRYRRQNRSELRGCLSRVLRRARTVSAPLNSVDSSTNVGWSSSRWTRGDNDEFDAEADERINRAVRADAFALDD